MKAQENLTDRLTENSENESQDKSEALSCPKYINQAFTVVTEALKSGCDVIQMPNGDIVIREQKTVTTKFSWNTSKEKIVKNSTEIENPTNHILNS